MKIFRQSFIWPYRIFCMYHSCITLLQETYVWIKLCSKLDNNNLVFIDIFIWSLLLEIQNVLLGMSQLELYCNYVYYVSCRQYMLQYVYVLSYHAIWFWCIVNTTRDKAIKIFCVIINMSKKGTSQKTSLRCRYIWIHFCISFLYQINEALIAMRVGLKGMNSFWVLQKYSWREIPYRHSLIYSHLLYFVCK